MRKLQNTLLRLFPVVFLFAFVLAFTSGNFAYAEEESTYGHISYVDTEATVIREDQTEHKAVVNLPVAPGDQVVTGENGRCELQFDNGTVIRLDKNTRLKVTTVLAPSLTSHWKVTTLRLLDGQIYAMVQSYNREMFQVVTPNAAFDLKKRSAAFIQVRDSGDTFIHADKGKFKVMYGEDADSLKTETIRSGGVYTITADNQSRTGDDFLDLEFKAWNDYVNRNFKDLHFGISKLPKKITRNPALVYWTEKWSSLFGEWVYDAVFGYVWRPYDEFFAYSARPFFHADFVWVNNKLILVPQEPWGWIPAHLGTWMWTKGGWTWIPGEAFNTGVGQFSFINRYYGYPTLSCWIYEVYGGYDLYYTYRTYGVGAWRSAYEKVYYRPMKKPSLANVPGSVRDIIKKMNNTPVKVLREHLGTVRQLPTIDVKNIKSSLIKKESPLHPDGTVRTRPTGKTGVSSTVKVKPGTPGKGSVPVPVNHRWSAREEQSVNRGKVKVGGPVRNFRDWNPDIQWGIQTGNKVHYSSKTNEMVCPDLKLTSRSVSSLQRRAISRSTPSRRGYSSSGVSSSSGSTGSASSSQAGSTSGFGANKGSGGDKGSGSKKNK
jgi:hypothetical protein